MRKLLAALALGLLLPLAEAAPSLQNTLPTPGATLLPAEEAFSASARMLDENYLRVEFIIAPGYYLYRDKLAFAADSAVLALGVPSLPGGETIEDEFFGKTVIYREHLALDIPLARNGELKGPFPLRVFSQGCSESPAVCYPRLVQNLRVTPIGEDTAPPLATAGTARNAALPGGETAGLMTRLGQGSRPLVLLSFLGLGILLAFTPCVLPLLPVLAGIIAGPGGTAPRRAFSLSLVYVLAMAVTYALAGVAAGISGTALQSAIQQNPWVLSLTVLLLVLLALSMFGFYSLQLPTAISTRLDNLLRRQGGGGPAGSVVMGVLSALVLSPCVSPPLVAALAYIASTGDAWLGGAALFALGLGLGLPLLLFALTAGRLLPKAGPWMEQIRTFVGILLLGLAAWFAQRLLPPVVGPALLGLLLLAHGLWLWQASVPAMKWRPLFRSLALASGLWGALLLVGAAAGGGTLLHPLKSLATAAPKEDVRFMEVKGTGGLEQALAAAAGRPAMLDVYADWCISCREMEAFTFPAPEVQAALKGTLLLRADVTEVDAEDRSLLRLFGLFGAPAVLFFDRQGKEIQSARVIGYLAAPDFARTAAQAFE